MSTNTEGREHGSRRARLGRNGVGSRKEPQPEAEGVLVNAKASLETKATEAIGHLREHESDKVPAKESSEQRNSWMTPSFTPRELVESELQLACPPEVLRWPQSQRRHALLQRHKKSREMVRWYLLRQEVVVTL